LYPVFSPWTLRCCADLRRLSDRRSRSFGFPAPPSTFSPCGVAPGVFRRPAFRSVSLPALAPSVALHPPSRTSLPSRSSLPARRATTVPSSCPSSLRVLRPFGALSPGNPLPGVAFPPRGSPARLIPCRLARDLPASPRRGVPIPLWSAFVVSRDLDGLPFPEPCDLFQPLTPMGFVFPLPASGRPGARPRGSEESRVRARGMGYEAKGSR
jgi:hypothetical protein